MPAPTNLTALTAIDLGAFPFTYTQRVDDAGTTYTVWVKFTAPAASVAVSLYGFGDLTTYIPTLETFNGPASAPVAININGQNVPIQMLVTPGTEYFLKLLTNAGNPSPANLTIEGAVSPNDTIQVGDIAVPDDTPGFPLVVLDSTTDFTIRRFTHALAGSEQGDIAANGNSLVANNPFGSESIFLYDSSFTQLANPAENVQSIRYNRGLDVFYIALNDPSFISAPIKTVTPAGVVSGVLATLTGNPAATIAASNDGSTLFFSSGSGNGPVKVWDLLTDSALPDIVAGDPNYGITDILVLEDDTLLVCYVNGGVFQDAHVKRFDASGTLLNTYAMGSNDGRNPSRLAYALDSPNSFWVWMHPLSGGSPLNVSHFKNVKISDGSILTDRQGAEFKFGAYVHDFPGTLTPTAVLGNSPSCPFFIMPVAGGVAGSIVVTKTTPGLSGITTSFPFGATGGLSPSSFSLTPTNSHTFSSVPAGSGYGISETAPDGWTVNYTVSNGSPVNNIIVGSGETVTVTAANTVTHTGQVDPVRRLRQTAHLSDEQVWLFFSKFQLDVQTGVGLNDGQGSDPQVMLSWSDDGGHTWSAERWVSAGKQGEYKRRAIWRQLGRSRDRVWRIVVSDPVAWRILAAYIDVQKGTS